MSKSTGRRGVRTRQSARTGAFEVIMHPERTRPGQFIGFLVRLRAEIFVVTSLVLASVWLINHLPTWACYTVLITVGLLCAAVPPIRRYLTRRYWCVISRHRVRACFRSTWTMTHNGALPYLLWSRPTPVGERIRVWLPAGLSVQDIERVADKLATACWARECRIEHDRKRAASAVIHIARRDPLDKSGELAPEVLDHIDVTDDHSNVVPLPSRDDVINQVTTSSEAGQLAHPIEHTAARSSRGKTANPQKTTNDTNNEDTDPEIVGFGGVDVSDYV